MKSYMMSMVAVLVSQLAFAQGWEWQNPLPQGNRLGDVCFVDIANGWAAGAGGTILHTVDGGATWTRQLTGVTLPVTAIEFVDSRHGWATTNQSWVFPFDPPFVLRTTNGGATWLSSTEGTGGGLYDLEFLTANDGWAVGAGEIQHTGDGIHWVNRRPWDYRFHDFYSVSFGDQDHGWIVGWHRTTGAKVIIATPDRGETWVVQHVAWTWLRFVDFVDLNNGWVVGDGGSMLRTTNGGANWTEQPAPDSGGLNYVHFLDMNRGWVTGANGTFHTDDGGATWTRQDSSGGRVSFLNASTGWVVDGVRIAHTSDGGATWQPQSSTVTAQSLASVQFLNAQQGWAVGDSGTIVRTMDGGQHWAPSARTTDRDLRSLMFVDEANGWALAAGSSMGSDILHTADGGESWELRPSGWGPALNQVVFIDAMRGWAVGDSGLIIHSIDGGLSWSRQFSGTTLALHSIDVIDATQAWIVGDHCWYVKPSPGGGGGWHCRSATLRTDDGGHTWATVDTSYVAKTGVDFVDASHGWVIGWTIQRTTDGGDTWIEREADWSSYSDIEFVNADEGWVIGDNSILHTTDGGVSWSQQTSDNANLLNSVSFAGPAHGWAVGADGTILHYSGDTWVTPSAPAAPDQFSLDQNYPNPFNSSTTIEYDLPRAGRISLRVFDLLGREVAVLKDGIAEAGTHRVTFDGNDLASGIYFARLEAEESAQTVKLVLLR